MSAIVWRSGEEIGQWPFGVDWLWEGKTGDFF